jgi:signal transduction histidine kinase
MMRRRSQRPPPWWPATEPWPPAERPWRRGRSRFIRRVAFVWAIVLFLSALGTGSLTALLFGVRHSSFRGPQLWVFIWPVFIIVFAVAMRRFGMPLGNVVEAADRLAGGDFNARVPEEGPASLRRVGRAFNGMAARLQSQDRQRRHLMADIAHELRTPLSVIRGRLEGLLDGVYPTDEAQLRQVLDDARMLSRLVDDLQTLSHAESGTLKLHMEPTDLVALSHDVVDTLSAEAAAGGVPLAVTAGLDVALVHVDPLRIREVLMNLISNALRYTPRGGSITIAVNAGQPGVVLAVTDTGKGMTREETARIFDRFYKGRTSHGSGLGLTIARNLVIAHGGEITCVSEPGRGTTFSVRLPVSR